MGRRRLVVLAVAVATAAACSSDDTATTVSTSPSSTTSSLLADTTATSPTTASAMTTVGSSSSTAPSTTLEPSTTAEIVDGDWQRVAPEGLTVAPWPVYLSTIGDELFLVAPPESGAGPTVLAWSRDNGASWIVQEFDGHLRLFAGPSGPIIHIASTDADNVLRVSRWERVDDDRFTMTAAELSGLTSDQTKTHDDRFVLQAPVAVVAGPDAWYALGTGFPARVNDIGEGGVPPLV